MNALNKKALMESRSVGLSQPALRALFEYIGRLLDVEYSIQTAVEVYPIDLEQVSGHTMNLKGEDGRDNP